MSPIQVIAQHPPGGRLWRWTAAQHGKNAVEHGTQGNMGSAACQEVVWEGADTDLARLPGDV